MGKHGILKGNSGLILDDNDKMIMHINAPYDNNGMVFVHTEDHMWWERMSLKQAKKEKREIITCCQCDKPATSLDHHYPWMIGQNLCDDHDYILAFNE